MLAPGDPRGRELGCTCPEEPNQGGKGTHTVGQGARAGTHFLIAESCPQHGKATWKED